VAQARLRHAALEVVHAAPDNASAGAEAEAHAMLERIITQEYPEGRVTGRCSRPCAASLLPPAARTVRNQHRCRSP